MKNMLLATLGFLFSINFGDSALKYCQVNREFKLINKTIFEVATYSLDELGNPIKPFYNKELLEHYIRQYFKDNISNITEDYSVSIYYFNREDGSICYDEVCRDICVTLNAKLNSYLSFNKTQNFSIYQRGEF